MCGKSVEFARLPVREGDFKSPQLPSNEVYGPSYGHKNGNSGVAMGKQETRCSAATYHSFCDFVVASFSFAITMCMSFK